MNYKGKEEEINAENYQMGNRYAKAYGRGLSLLNVRKLNIAGNRLNEKGTYNILKGLNKATI